MDRDRWYENVFVKGFLTKEILTRIVFLIGIILMDQYVLPRSRSGNGPDYPPLGIQLGTKRHTKTGMMIPWLCVITASMIINLAYLMYAVRNRRTRRQRFRMTVYFILMSTLALEGGVLLSESIKRVVARFRPDFLSRCYPNLSGMDLLKVSFALTMPPGLLQPAEGFSIYGSQLGVSQLGPSQHALTDSSSLVQSSTTVVSPAAFMPAGVTPAAVMPAAAIPSAVAPAVVIPGAVTGSSNGQVSGLSPAALNGSSIIISSGLPAGYIGRCTTSDAKALREGRMSFPSTPAVVACTCLFLLLLWDLHMVKVLAGYTGEILIIPTVLLLPSIVWLFKTLSSASHHSSDVAASVLLAAAVAFGAFTFYYPRTNASSQPGRADSLENDLHKSSSESFFMSTPGMPPEEPQSNSHYSERQSTA